MVCYYYPPLTDVGCKRSVSFSKYLKKYGWNPYILSVKNPDKTYCSVGNDKAPAGIRVEYSYSVVNLYKFFGKVNGVVSRIAMLFGIELSRNYFYDLFCVPDVFCGWIPLTILKGYKIVKKHDIDIIYVSCSPYSSAVIGILLKCLTGNTLVIDFRDPFGLEISWLKRVFSQIKLRKRFDRWFFEQVSNHTDLFIVTSDETKEMYSEQYPKVRDKMFVIHNGFDAEVLSEIKKGPKFSKFSIVYAGTFYFFALDSEVFFEAVGMLKKGGKVDKSSFQFLFYGDDDEKARLQEISRKYGIEDLVLTMDRIPYKEIISVNTKCHLQLLRIVRPMISTKLFEGIPLNIPFLATIPPGEVEGIIKEYSPSSYIVTNESSDEVAKAILDAMEKYRHKEILDNLVDEFLENYSRENLTVSLIRIMEDNSKIEGRSLCSCST